MILVDTNILSILKALWMFDIVSKEDVVQIIKEMEEKDNLKIVSKEEIFNYKEIENKYR